MPHLAVPRTGWENEHLATFLLSRVAFVAHPVTVADDIGSDFFCTLFEPRVDGGSEMLFPRDSFAIQVKSNREGVPATNKIEYLQRLELPFFLGVIDRSGPRLSVFSGEHLPMMFSHIGRPQRLTLRPVDDAGGYSELGPNGECTLRLPFVIDVAVADDREALCRKVDTLSQLCFRMHANISARTSAECIFKTDSSGGVVIMAGSGSVRTFRNNFHLRLAEVFYNLEWILQNRRSEFSSSEFQVYDRLYEDLLRQGGEIPVILRNVHARMKERLGRCNEESG